MDIDTFLFEKIKTKLDYWTNIHLFLAGWVVIANLVLSSTNQVSYLKLSSIWFYISYMDKGQLERLFCSQSC
jgi:hypothetical protein